MWYHANSFSMQGHAYSGAVAIVDAAYELLCIVRRGMSIWC